VRLNRAILLLVLTSLCGLSHIASAQDNKQDAKQDDKRSDAKSASAKDTKKDNKPKPQDMSKLPKKLQALLRQIDAEAAKIKDVSCQFEQHKHTPLLKKPLVSSGELRIVGPTMRWETLKPARSVMVVSARDLRLYYPDDRVVEIYDLDQKLQQLTASPIPRLGAMLKYFQIKPADTKDKEKTSTSDNDLLELTLIPHHPTLKQHIEHAQVLIDIKSAFSRQMHFVDVEGDRTVLYFRKMKFNTGMKASDLKLTVPGGTKISRPLKPKKSKSDPTTTPAKKKPVD